MAYCTQSDIQKVLNADILAQLTDDDESHDPPVVDSSIVTAAISYADAVINSYLRGKYDLPLDPLPPMVKDFSVNISIFRLYSRRPNVRIINESILYIYEDTIAQLKNIQKGLQTLGDDDSVSDTSVSQTGIFKTSKTLDQVYTKEYLDTY